MCAQTTSEGLDLKDQSSFGQKFFKESSFGTINFYVGSKF